ncbi:MAG: Stress responsive Barrel Domain-containing protein [Planctomycetota bacterium]|nr:Stress responsive Barrel Domain-containing protein [Planctomycetota bacterium]
MKSQLGWFLLVVAIALPALALAARPAAKPEPQLAHMVFFTLKDHSQASRDAFVASCQKYLTGHEGTVSISFGTIAEDVVEAPSVRDFDVALHVVFENKAANATYQKHPRHVAFVAENKEKFAKVRVFDSYLAPATK